MDLEEKKKGAKSFFRKNKGTKTSLQLKEGGEDFFKQNFPKSRPRYPVNFDRSLKLTLE